MLKRISEGTQMPPWYRMAYYDVMRNQSICAPIGIHLVVKFFRRIWERSYRYSYSDFENFCIDSHKIPKMDSTQNIEDQLLMSLYMVKIAFDHKLIGKEELEKTLYGITDIDIRVLDNIQKEKTQ